MFIPVSWTVTFPCVGSGQPNPAAVWMHDGEVIELEKRPNIAIYSDRLRITNVTVEDSGSYQCELVSDAGAAASKSARLKVIGEKFVILLQCMISRSMLLVCRCHSGSH